MRVQPAPEPTALQPCARWPRVLGYAGVRVGDAGAALAGSVLLVAAGRGEGAGVDDRGGGVALVVGIGAVLAAAVGDAPRLDAPLPAADGTPEDDASPVAGPGREVPFGADPGRNT